MQGNANHSGDMKELQTTLEMHSVNQKRTDFALTSLVNTKLYPTIAIPMKIKIMIKKQVDVDHPTRADNYNLGSQEAALGLC